MSDDRNLACIDHAFQFVSRGSQSIGVVDLPGHFLRASDPGSFGDVNLWDFETGGIVRHFRGYTNWGNVAFGPDEQTAFSAGGSASDGIIEWRIADMPLDELIEWAYAHRYIRDFTCEERALSHRAVVQWGSAVTRATRSQSCHV